MKGINLKAFSKVGVIGIVFPLIVSMASNKARRCLNRVDTKNTRHSLFWPGEPYPASRHTNTLKIRLECLVQDGHAHTRTHTLPTAVVSWVY